MTTDIPIHEQKLQAIERALAEVHCAKSMDERESMAEMTLPEASEYWDQLALGSKDVQVGAAAIEAECYIRRSERIANEPERRGGDQSQSKVTPSVTSAKKMERSRMRVVGKHAAAARKYVAAEVKANRLVTRKGIMQHVTQTRTSSSVKPRSTAALPGPWAGGRAKMRQAEARLLGHLDSLADGVRRKDSLLHSLVGDVDFYLQRVRLIPWLAIDRTPEGTVFTIDQDLRNICEGRALRPVLEGWTVRGFLKHIRAEITRRRKEANDTYQAANWRHGVVHTRFQSELLDWIETELDRVP